MSDAFGGFLEYYLFCLKGIQSGSYIPVAWADAPSVAFALQPWSIILLALIIMYRCILNRF